MPPSLRSGARKVHGRQRLDVRRRGVFGERDVPGLRAEQVGDRAIGVLHPILARLFRLIAADAALESNVFEDRAHHGQRHQSRTGVVQMHARKAPGGVGAQALDIDGQVGPAAEPVPAAGPVPVAGRSSADRSQWARVAACS